METNESIIELFHLGESKPDQPPRWAKVTAVGSDTVTVTLGAANVDAARCCLCGVGDVVLLETMPSGQLAAVATRGIPASGAVTRTKTSSQTIAADNTYEAVTWNSDTVFGTALTASGNGIKIGSGITHVMVSCRVNWSTVNGTATRYVRILKNSSIMGLASQSLTGGTAPAEITCTGIVVPVTSGDVISLAAYGKQGDALQGNSNKGCTYLTVQVLR